MKWFKHDSDANRDAKLKRVQIKYGMEGYGLYWYCIELIANGIDQHNLTFELEHDAEVIAHDTGIHHERVQEMMTFMSELGLFENNSGTITCMKLAKRIDQSMTSNPRMRAIIDQIRQSHDGVMTESCEHLTKSCKNRLDKIRLDKNKNINQNQNRSTGERIATIPPSKVMELYHEILPELPKVAKLTDKRKSHLKQRCRDDFQTIEDWRIYFKHIRESDFLMGMIPAPPNRKRFIADFDFLINESNAVKIAEGKYHA